MSQEAVLQKAFNSTADTICNLLSYQQPLIVKPILTFSTNTYTKESIERKFMIEKVTEKDMLRWREWYASKCNNLNKLRVVRDSTILMSVDEVDELFGYYSSYADIQPLINSTFSIYVSEKNAENMSRANIYGVAYTAHDAEINDAAVEGLHAAHHVTLGYPKDKGHTSTRLVVSEFLEFASREIRDLIWSKHHIGASIWAASLKDSGVCPEDDIYIALALAKEDPKYFDVADSMQANFILQCENDTISFKRETAKKLGIPEEEFFDLVKRLKASMKKYSTTF